MTGSRIEKYPFRFPDGATAPGRAAGTAPIGSALCRPLGAPQEAPLPHFGPDRSGTAGASPKASGGRPEAALGRDLMAVMADLMADHVIT